MKTVSIKEMIEGSSTCQKFYDALYSENGYESGFGRGGCYTGHSHRFFYDILFSPDGIHLKDDDSGKKHFIVIVPPRTFMDDVRIGDFFFIKFCPTSDSFQVTEKTNSVLREGIVMPYSEAMRFDSVWYRNPDTEGQTTALYLADMLRDIGPKITRLGYGMPLGGNIDYIDEMTLSHALKGRTKL